MVKRLWYVMATQYSTNKRRESNSTCKTIYATVLRNHVCNGNISTAILRPLYNVR